MEVWAIVRRRVLTGEISKRQACREYQLSWHLLEKILSHDQPPGYQKQVPRGRPKMEPFLRIIDEILETDKKAPKKQRHTAKRIYDRLVEEHKFDGSYTSVKNTVRKWRQGCKEAFLPLSHPPGEAQVDFGFAEIDLAGERVKVALFVMSLPYSDAFFVQAFPSECTESFQEGHKRSFEFFGGVPARISYDNSRVAVSKFTGSRSRVLTNEFLRLQSHYLFKEHFCLVRRANEKGHVEQLVGFGRRNFLVPVPRVNSIEELNEHLHSRCTADLDRRLTGKSQSKRELLAEEREFLLDLPKQAFDARRVTRAAANSLSLVRFDTNNYSVPVKYAHREITIVATVDQVRLVHQDQLVATHPRGWKRSEFFFNPVHYLALLEKKPGGFDFARPLQEWKLPECFSVLRRRLENDQDGMGTLEYIRVLRLLENCSLPQLTDAVGYALDIGVGDAHSVRVILEHRQESPVALFSLDGRPHLKTVHVAQTDVTTYQSLLTEETR